MYESRIEESPGGISPGTKADLTFAVLGGMLAWVLHLAVSYLLVPFVCGTGRTVFLHGATGAAALLAAGAAWRGWRLRGRLGAGTGPSDGPRTIHGFLANFGVALSAFFLVLIVVEGLPAALQPDPCLQIPTLDRPIILRESFEDGLRTWMASSSGQEGVLGETFDGRHPGAGAPDFEPLHLHEGEG